VIDRLTATLAGRYRIERELGQGGMATVYLAEDVRHHRKVAIKVLHPELSAVLGPDRFLKEIELTANLQHPHILPLFDSGAADGLLFYVMPLVEGETLRTRLTREKQLPIADAVRIATEVASALDYAHRRNVIHRDIKPENILLHDGRALVADFGIALAVVEAGGSRMTQTGISLGTPQYMSPEQAMGERAISARSDLYALGCVSYEMLTGEPPFTGATAQAIVARVLTEEPRGIRAQRNTVPVEVEEAVLVALAKLPSDRFGNAAEFAAAISGEGPGRRLPTGARVPARDAITPGRVVPLVLAATTVLALAWGAWEMLRSRPAPSAPLMRFTLRVPMDRTTFGNNLALSPDGTQLAFVTRPALAIKPHLMIRRFDRLEATALAGTDDAASPFFSPNGEWIGFSTGRVLRKVRSDGGGATTIAGLASGVELGESSWGPGDVILFADRTNHVYRVSADGGTPIRVGEGDSAQYNAPSWLPDGKRFLASRLTGDGSIQDIVVVSAETGRTLATLGQGYVPRYVPPGFLIWMSLDGRLLAAPFDAKSTRLRGRPNMITEGLSSQSRTILWTVADNGTIVFSPVNWADKELLLVSSEGVVTTLPVGSRAFRGPRFSPDGRRIAVDVEPGGDLVGDVWLFDRGSSAFTRLTLEGTSVFPEWTPRGDGILYSSGTSSTRRSLFRVPADRSGPPVLLKTGAAPIFEGVLTPDEKTLIYRENADSTGRDIQLLAGGKSTRFAAGLFDERTATPSRDGRWVLYVSNESGRDEVYLRPIDGQGRVQVSASGGTEPRWGPGGKLAYYRFQDTLFAVPILPGPAVGARRVVLVGPYTPEAYHTNYDVAPDGSAFVFVKGTRQDATSDLTVVLNWFAAVLRGEVR